MSTQHRNDIYGSADQPNQIETPAIPAATVILLRDSERGVETLLLHRTSKVHFGGMWVFPGGRIDEADYPENKDVDVAAQRAAVRETLEETNIAIGADAFAWFAHWTPPAGTPRRYATWFFASILETDQVIAVDGFEIQNHEWIQPAEALARHAAGDIDLAPPTWITLHQLARHQPAKLCQIKHVGTEHNIPLLTLAQTPLHLFRKIDRSMPHPPFPVPRRQ